MSVETVVNAVEAEVKKVEGEVVAVVEKTLQEITAEEKLVIREIENEYLKAQMEIQRFSQITQGAQKKFTDTVESLVKRYAVSPTEWLFDNVSLVFKKK